MERVDVYRCSGRFGDVDVTFRVYADGTVFGSMDHEPVEYNRREVQSGQRILNGRVVKQYAPDDYDVEYTVATWRSEDDGKGEGIFCTAVLSPQAVEGHYRYKSSTKEDFFSFAVEGESCHSIERLEMPCAPLTPGFYRFKGSSMTSEVKLREEYLIEMELRSDGSVDGTMQGSLWIDRNTEMEIEGTWTPDHIHFLVTGSYSGYEFTGTPTLAGFRGTWVTDEVEPEDEDYGSGQCDFSIQTCERRAWCESLHRFFPPAFLQSVRYLLLSSARAPVYAALPNTLWREVLSFTSQDWFTGEVTSI